MIDYKSIEQTLKAAKQKQDYLETQIAQLPIDAFWKAALQHSLSKMGGFYSEAYHDMKKLVESDSANNKQ